MASISKIIAGQTLYDVHSVKMGNTTIRRKGCWTVEVKEVDTVNGRALCSWNGNRPTWYSERQLKKLKVKKPEPKSSRFGMPSY